MSTTTILLDLLLAGFFAIACLRARDSITPGQKLAFSDFFRLSDRVERLRRSRWQWFSMVALVLVLRMQQTQPLMLEFIVVLQFLVFLALPTKTGTRKRALAR